MRDVRNGMTRGDRHGYRGIAALSSMMLEGMVAVVVRVSRIRVGGIGAAVGRAGRLLRKGRGMNVGVGRTSTWRLLLVGGRPVAIRIGLPS